MHSQLPKDFLHGFATASYQIEGSTTVDGRGSSIWDDMCREPGRIIDGSNGDVATDSYKRFKEDITLLKSYGANSYRFSLSWSRIIPLGGSEDPINPLGVAFYNKVIDELLANDIVPFVTLYHWDLPSALQERYNGWLDKTSITRDFTRYARVCFEAFGDRVSHWLTLNEPWCSSILGHSVGAHAPGRTSDRTKSPHGDSSTEPWIAGHSLIIAHASAVKVYREEFRHKSPQGKGVIGVTLNGDWCEPWDGSEDNVAAAQRALEFAIAWFADPIYLTGAYPASMRTQLGTRLPEFTAEEKALVFGSSDFYGMNTYSANLVKAKKGEPKLEDFQGNVEYTTEGPDGSKALGPLSDLGWLQDVPWGFEKLLKWLWDRYKTPIYVTENGFCVKEESQLSLEDAITDTDRVHYFKGYLGALENAVSHGVVIKSYFAWSLLDNFEWAEGYVPRFGVTYVDYKTQKRTPKESAMFIKKWFEERTE